MAFIVINLIHASAYNVLENSVRMKKLNVEPNSRESSEKKPPSQQVFRLFTFSLYEEDTVVPFLRYSQSDF